MSKQNGSNQNNQAANQAKQDPRDFAKLTDQAPAAVTPPAAAAPPAVTPPTHEDDPILNMSEVARQLGKHPSTIKVWIQTGLLDAIRMPSNLYGVRKSQVNRVLAGSALARQVT